MCPESLGAKLRCVEDSLRARGYQVRVEVGRRARRFVRKAPPGPPTVRILCVASIEPQLAEKLRRGIDPEGDGYFHVLGVTTPFDLVKEIEQRLGRPRSRRIPRPSRMILAQPTLIEQQLRVDETRWRSIAAAAVVVLVAGGVFAAFGSSGSVASAVTPSVDRTVMEQRVEGRLQPEDGPVYSAAARP